MGAHQSRCSDFRRPSRGHGAHRPQTQIDQERPADYAQPHALVDEYGGHGRDAEARDGRVAASAVAAPSPETKPTAKPLASVRRTQSSPIGPNTAAIESPSKARTTHLTFKPLITKKPKKTPPLPSTISIINSNPTSKPLTHNTKTTPPRPPGPDLRVI